MILSAPPADSLYLCMQVLAPGNTITSFRNQNGILYHHFEQKFEWNLYYT